MKAMAHERRALAIDACTFCDVINPKKLFRLLAGRETLGAPPRRPKAGDRNQGADGDSAPNDPWSLDFVDDRTREWR